MKRLVSGFLFLVCLASGSFAFANARFSCPTEKTKSDYQRFIFSDDGRLELTKTIWVHDLNEAQEPTAITVLSSKVNKAQDSYLFELEGGGSLQLTFKRSHDSVQIIYDAPGVPEFPEVFDDCNASYPEAGVTAHN